MTSVTITVDVDVIDPDAAIARAKELGRQEGWPDDYEPTLAQAVVDIVNVDGGNRYLSYFAGAEQPNGGWQAAEVAS